MVDFDNKNNIFKYQLFRQDERQYEHLPLDKFDEYETQIEKTILGIQKAMLNMEDSDYFGELSIGKDKIFFKSDSDVSSIMDLYFTILQNKHRYNPEKEMYGVFDGDPIFKDAVVFVPGENDSNQDFINDIKSIRKLNQVNPYAVSVPRNDTEVRLIEDDYDVTKFAKLLNNRRLQEIRKKANPFYHS